MSSLFVTPQDSALVSWLRFRSIKTLGRDSSSVGVDFTTKTGTPNQVTTGHPYYGMNLVRTNDTTGEGLSVAGASAPRLNITTQSFTVGAWVKTDILNADVAQTKHVVSKWDAGAGARQWRLFLHTTDQFLLEWSTNGTNSFSVGTGGGTTITKTDWWFVVATYDRTNTRARIYLNGAQEDETTSNIANLTSQSTEIALGYFNNSGKLRWWDGILSEFFFMDRALSADEVRTVWQYGIRRSVHSGYAMSANGAHDWRSRLQSDGSRLILS